VKLTKKKLENPDIGQNPTFAYFGGKTEYQKISDFFANTPPTALGLDLKRAKIRPDVQNHYFFSQIKKTLRKKNHLTK
jgi:hypothetical protein